MINQESFLQQNKSINVSIDNIQLRREGNYYQLIANGELVMDYIEFFFQLNDRQFHVFDVNTRKWTGYKKIADAFEKIYESKYLILHYPDIVIEYSEKMFFIYAGGFDHSNSLAAKNLLFVGDNFKINKGGLVATNMKQLRMLRYDFKKKTAKTEIIKNGKNKKTYGKTDVFFDNIGGVEIFDKKEKLWRSSTKFYQLTEKFYCVKENDSYVVVDVEHKKTIFTGTVLSYMENIVNISNHGTDEVMIVDKASETIRVYAWSKYKAGETKEYLTFYYWR